MKNFFVLEDAEAASIILSSRCLHVHVTGQY